jgi:hypothetical protein
MRKTLILALLFAAGCPAEDGDKGSTGADGTDGTTGGDGADGADGADGTDGATGGDGADGDDAVGWDNEFAGTVTGPDGPIEGATVSMWLVDDHAAGVSSSAIAGAVTGADGTYSIHLSDIDAANLHLIALAQTDDGDAMYSLVYGTDISVSPGSTAVTDIISWIVQPDGERSIGDYDLTEVETLTTAADAALVTAGTDLSDWSAVITQVLEDVGGDIADSSEGPWTAVAGDGTPVATEPADAYTGDVSSSFTYLYDGAGEEWDIYYYYGYISDGSADSYDGYGYLYIDENLWYYSSDYGTYEDDDEMVIGPTTLSGLTTTRKLYVDPVEGYLRYMEVLTNDTAADITVDVYIRGNLGSDETNDLYSYTSSGDDTPDPTDVWTVNNQSSDPAVGFIFPGAEATKAADTLYFTWSDVTVPAGSEVNIIHWAIQDSVGTGADMAADLGAAVDPTTGAPTDSSWYGGLSTDNVFDNVVGLASDTIVGEAGAVAPFSEVTLDNTTSGATMTVSAESDGSFAAAIAAETGDSIELSCTDGSTGTVVVP